MNDHGLILKTKRDASNNLIVKLKGKDMRVALAVAHAFVHNPNAFQYQIYKDGDKGNCRADNIEWGMPGRDNNDGLSKAISLVKSQGANAHKAVISPDKPIIKNISKPRRASKE